METKISVLRGLMDQSKWADAIKYAAKFPRLGNERDAILRAKDALNNPAFYKQLKQDPAELIEAGRVALVAKYSV